MGDLLHAFRKKVINDEKRGGGGKETLKKSEGNRADRIGKTDDNSISRKNVA